MAGHSHWAGIKRQKAAADHARAKSFAKLLAAVTAAAQGEPNPDFNPRLRTAIEKARQEHVPAENIERAVRRTVDPGGRLERVVCEAYGAGGTAILVEALTDNKNRTIAEIKRILAERGGKWADPGSVRWAFEPGSPVDEIGNPKFTQAVSSADAARLASLVVALRARTDVRSVRTNASTDPSS